MKVGSIGKFLILGIAFCVMLTNLWSNPQFTLPDGIPGIRFPDIPCSKDSTEMRMCISVPGTQCVLSFPKKGFQPTTCDAGEWSGARYIGQPNDDAVTDWWVRVFGGDLAVCMANDREISTTKISKICPIIQMATQENYTELDQFITIEDLMAFEQTFWQTFRTIAADPVGRVLLYRLLIEIRRFDDRLAWCCEDTSCDDGFRGSSRTITIYKSSSGCEYSGSCLNVKTEDVATLVLKMMGPAQNVSTYPKVRNLDVGLFHEMVHWFHYLRSPERYTNNSERGPQFFKYAMRCYYGDQTELAVWDSYVNSEDIATVLGSPNYAREEHRDFMLRNTFCKFSHLDEGGRKPICVTVDGVRQYIPFKGRFLNGDDLSENAYRCSKGLPMRFGHTGSPIACFPYSDIPNRFWLAHQVACDCYQEITGHAPDKWGLCPGQAIDQ